MTPAELHAKARRAAEWFKRHKHGDCFANEDLDGWAIYSGITLNDGSIRHCMTDGPFSDGELITFCEDRGWQDDHIGDANKMVEPCADEHEALDCCARGMAQTMDEIDPEPIQLEEIAADDVVWISNQAQAWVNNCFLEVDRLAHGKWAYKMTPTKNRVLLSTQSSGGTAPTIEEAKRRAVEAARGMNNENV